MKANTVLLYQAALIALQIINAGINIDPTIHVPPLVALIVAAVVGGFQFYVNHLGNQKVEPTVK
jgi:uncharacterized membrane-anchored protein